MRSPERVLVPAGQLDMHDKNFMHLLFEALHDESF